MRSPTDYQFSLADLLRFTTVTAVLLGIAMVCWGAALYVLGVAALLVGQRRADEPGTVGLRWFSYAGCLALGAVLFALAVGSMRRDLGPWGTLAWITGIPLLLAVGPRVWRWLPRINPGPRGGDRC